jgi:hypothetical protein
MAKLFNLIRGNRELKPTESIMIINDYECVKHLVLNRKLQDLYLILSLDGKNNVHMNECISSLVQSILKGRKQLDQDQILKRSLYERMKISIRDSFMNISNLEEPKTVSCGVPLSLIEENRNIRLHLKSSYSEYLDDSSKSPLESNCYQSLTKESRFFKEVNQYFDQQSIKSRAECDDLNAENNRFGLID